MADALAQAREVIQKRLSELRAETKRLEAALGALGERKSVRHRPARTKAGSSARRGRKGQRAEQFKRAVAKNPGARVSEIAKKMGISSQQGHGIAKRLRERGEIRKQGDGYALKS